MTPNDHERETLSALFDGELDGEARRFAMRRLAHDTAWQEDCGRWQLIGDAMRCQAPIVARADLAERIRREVHRAPDALPVAPAVASVAAPSRASRRVWIGGALAASVALAAVIGLRTPATAPATAPAVASVAKTSAPSPSAIPTTVTPTPAAPAVVESQAVVPRVASTASPRPAVERAAPRPHSARTASRSDAPADAAVAAATPSPVVFPTDVNPFHIPASYPLLSRPWPRASLGGSGALTASFGSLGETRPATPLFQVTPPADAPPADAHDTP